MNTYTLYRQGEGCFTNFSRHYRSGMDILTIRATSLKQAFWCAHHGQWSKLGSAGIQQVANSQGETRNEAPL